MSTDQKESGTADDQKGILQEIVAIPATLYFPPRIAAQLNEICEQCAYTPWQLIVHALKGQIDHWDEFYKYVTTPKEQPEDFIWTEDPLFWLASITILRFINNFALCARDPVALEQLKEQSPANWSFSSLEGPEDPEPADWWKKLS